jgi:restriction system protein
MTRGTIPPWSLGSFACSIPARPGSSSAATAHRPKSRLIAGEQFVELVLQHYGKLAPRYRSLIPLKQIYVPDLPQA